MGYNSTLEWVIGRNLPKQKPNAKPNTPQKRRSQSPRRRVVAYVEISDKGSSSSDVSIDEPIVVGKKKVRFDEASIKKSSTKEDSGNGKFDSKEAAKAGGCNACLLCKTEKEAELLKAKGASKDTGECGCSTCTEQKKTEDLKEKQTGVDKSTDCTACTQREQTKKLNRKEQKGEKKAELSCVNCQGAFQSAEASKSQARNSESSKAQKKLHQKVNRPQSQDQINHTQQQQNCTHQQPHHPDRHWNWQSQQSNPQQRRPLLNISQNRSSNNSVFPTRQQHNLNLSAHPSANMVKRVIQSSRGAVVLREDVIECPSDPKPNAFFDLKTGVLRVYHGPIYGNPFASLIPLSANMVPIGAFPPQAGQFDGFAPIKPSKQQTFPQNQRWGEQSSPIAPQNNSQSSQQRPQSPVNNDWSGSSWQHPGTTTTGTVPGAWVNDSYPTQEDTSGQDWGNSCGEKAAAPAWEHSGYGHGTEDEQSNEMLGNEGNRNWEHSGRDTNERQTWEGAASGDAYGDGGNTDSWNAPTQTASNGWEEATQEQYSGDNQQWGASDQQTGDAPPWQSPSFNNSSQNQSSTWGGPSGSRSWGNIDAANSTKSTGSTLQQSNNAPSWGGNSGGGGRWNGQDEENSGGKKDWSNSGSGGEKRAAWGQDPTIGARSWGGWGPTSKDSGW